MKNKEPKEVYDEEGGYWDDGYLPDGEHHNEMPLTPQDKKIIDSLNTIFDNAWIHG